MPSLIKISEAAAIAVHSIDYMIRKKESVYIASNVAKELSVSYNHLSKILQLLVKHGYLKTLRGPSGGYSLTEKGENAKIKDLIELIDGKPEKNNCFMNKKVCLRETCALKKFIEKMTEEFENIIDVKIKDF